MALTLEDFNGMELMWEQLPKKPDENHVTLGIADIDIMWQLGLVDTKQFPIETWRATFDGHQQADGTFLLTKHEFLAKEKYRYKGEIMIPFDATKINEGKYTDEGLKELFDLSITPSCIYTPAEMAKFMDDFKDEFRDKGNLIKVDYTAKSRLGKLLEDHPSPLRRLELLFDSMVQNGETKGVSPYSISQEELAKLQASSFSLMPVSEAEIKTRALHLLEKKLPKNTPNVGDTTLKQIKRSRKGLKG